MAGSPWQLVDKLERFSAIGATRMYLQVLDMSDLEHLDLLADELLSVAAGLP